MVAALPCLTYFTEEAQVDEENFRTFYRKCIIIRHSNAHLYPVMKPFSIQADSMKKFYIVQSEETLYSGFISSNIFYDL